MSETITLDSPTGSSFASLLEGNKNAMAKIEELKSKKISAAPRNLVFAGLSVAAMFFLGMFAFQIVSGILALVLTVGVGVGGFMGLRFLKAMDPVVRQKTKNYVLKKMIEEARKNAAAQLDNQVILNADRLSSARKARDDMGALVEKLKGKIDEKGKGTSMYERKVEMLQRVSTAYETVCANLEQGARANKDFARKVKEYKEMEAFADMANQAMAMFASSGSSELEGMLSLAAFEHIEGEFNGAIVAIENSSRDMLLEDIE